MNSDTNEVTNEPQTAYKYAIYARKSTEGLERQYRSIGDQIDDCKILVKRDGLKLVGKPIEERKSAKVAKKRPEFKDLIKRIKSGEIDGIIAWHPDRLARNMAEASIILDMLGNGKLKDLRFFSMPFSNDPGGRMMLGLMFVLATHYSEELSVKASRGVQKKFSEGGLGGYPKLGYIQKKGYYKTDTENNNFGLIQEAWQMRAKGAKHEEIMEYLNTNNFSQIVKDERKIRIIRTNDLTRMFMGKHSSFYYGIAAQADGTVDLRELLPDFVPLTDETTYAKVQAVGYKRKRGSGKKLDYFLPFRDILFCETCHDERPLIIYRSKGRSGKYYIYTKCKNANCSRKPKDVRGKVVSDAVSKVLKKVSSRLTEEAYKKYLVETKELSAPRKQALRGENISLQAYATRLRDDNRAFAKQVVEIRDPEMKEEIQRSISENMRIIANQTVKIEANKQKFEATSMPAFTIEEFNTLVQTMSERFNNGSLVQRDIIIRSVFLNLHFDGIKIANYSLAEPFATLLKSEKLSLGWENVTQFEPIPASIEHTTFADVMNGLRKFGQLLNDLASGNNPSIIKYRYQQGVIYEL
jgi:site-specific DNA recombinase